MNKKVKSKTHWLLQTQNTYRCGQ